MGYECLLAGLPDLKAGGEAPMSMDALLELFGETLTEKDLQLLSVLRMPSDAQEVLDKIAEYDETILNQPTWWEDAREVLSETDLRTQVLYERLLPVRYYYSASYVRVPMHYSFRCQGGPFKARHHRSYDSQGSLPRTFR